MDRFVWVGDETDQDWMRGGSYLVSRRIRMLIESWDTDFLGDQEQVFGRAKDSGAPLTGIGRVRHARTSRRRKRGKPVIDLNAHIRLAAPASNGGQMILRRGYSYTDGIDQRTGLLDAGLFFLAYQKDPRTQFVPIQRRLGQNDLLNEYIRHTSSALFAVPPGLVRGGGLLRQESLLRLTDSRAMSVPFSAYGSEIYLHGMGGTRPAFTTNAVDLEDGARRTLPDEAYWYVAGAAGSGATYRANRAAFDDWRIVPHMLTGATAARPLDDRRSARSSPRRS